jgi:hypothetical protein
VHAVIEEWVQHAGVPNRPPDHVQVNKGHGRLERRELWVVAGGELSAYLEQEYGWPQMRCVGQIRRLRRRLRHAAWESEQSSYWIAGGKLPPLTPAQLQTHLRRHWTIENAVFYIRDVTLDEDRLQGRAIGPALSALRNGAINLIRRTGFRYVPDARRFLPARPDLGLSLLFDKPKLEH